MKIEVSIGEVVDKITILQIKTQKISDKFKQKIQSEKVKKIICLTSLLSNAQDWMPYLMIKGF